MLLFKFFKSSLFQLYDVQCLSELFEIYFHLNYSNLIFTWITRISSSPELLGVQSFTSTFDTQIFILIIRQLRLI